MKWHSQKKRTGFTLLEMTIAAALTGLLGLMLATAWSAYDRAAAGLIARCRLSQEADLAMQALSVDLASGRAQNEAGNRDRGRPTGLAIEDDGTRLRIRFDDAEFPENAHAVVFEIQEELHPINSTGTLARRQKLVRWVESVEPIEIVEAPRIIAWDAKAIGLDPIQGDWYRFRLTFGLPFVEDRKAGMKMERTYSLIATVP